MQYDAIILELMSRIKTLEEEMAQLKELVNASADDNAPVQRPSLGAGTNNHPTQYQKMTDEMIEMCYEYGKKTLTGSNPQDLADELVNLTGINRNSAIMYLNAVNGMLTGGTYKRAINTKAMRYYLKMIYKDYGSQGLRKALSATRRHIQYRREYGQRVDYLEDICKQFDSCL